MVSTVNENIHAAAIMRNDYGTIAILNFSLSLIVKLSLLKFFVLFFVSVLFFFIPISIIVVLPIIAIVIVVTLSQSLGQKYGKQNRKGAIKQRTKLI